MASKRKSSVPCMVPAKSKTLREEIVVGCLPELLPTIPEDSILSISGKNGDEAQRTPKHAGSSTCCERVTHSCLPCGFETTDLNLFLNHMDTCHTDFHTQPLFYCLSCNVSLENFEGLALHNAKTHSEANPAKWSLQVTKHHGVIRVEQALLREKDHSSEFGPSISKMPVMKLMVKGEQKDIVFPHVVEMRRTDLANDRLVVVGNGTTGRHELPAHITGTVSFPMLKTPNPYGLPPQNARPLWNVSPSPDPNSDLPKVMIPLSSIPTYEPAMDLNSFLKASFAKFPYPIKAELCYLTVVSGFPEEQIKLWFAAQRLKQGISWSPEEIEDTRRKMFNTVFQAAPKTFQKKSQHLLSQHCVPVQSVRSGHVPYVPKGNTVGWKGGAVLCNVQGSFQLVKEIENGVFPQKTGNNLLNRGIHKHGENGGQSGEGKAVNLTHAVTSVDCNVNKSANGTSRPSPTPASESKDVPHISTSNKSNNVYKSSSLSIICTKVDGVLDHNSRETSTRTGEVLPVLADSLGAQNSPVDTDLGMSKLPEDLQSVIHSPIQEQDKLGAGRDTAIGDSQSAMGQVDNISSAALCSVDAPLQEDDNQPSAKATPTQLERLSPKSLEAPQVLFSDSPLAAVIHYKDHDAPALNNHPLPFEAVTDKEKPMTPTKES